MCGDKLMVFIIKNNLHIRPRDSAQPVSKATIEIVMD